MDEKKLQRIKEKIAYFREIGENQKADQLENKIKKVIAKKNFKENRTKTKAGKILQNIKKKVVKTAEDVGDVVSAGVTAASKEIKEKKNK